MSPLKSQEHIPIKKKHPQIHEASRVINPRTWRCKKIERGEYYHVGVLVLVDNPSVLKLDVEVLINGMQSPSDCKVILQLHRHFSSHQVLEVWEEQLNPIEIEHKRKDPDIRNRKEPNICWRTTTESEKERKEKRRTFRNRSRLWERNIGNYTH